MKTTRPEVVRVPIADIKVGRRHRKDMGDLERLAASIRERGGLLQPVAVTEGFDLIAGARRLAACKLLGMTHVPAYVIRVDDLLLAEHDADALCKQLTLSEKVAVAEAVRVRLGEPAGPPDRPAAAGRLHVPVRGGLRRGGLALPVLRPPRRAEGRTMPRVRRLAGGEPRGGEGGPGRG